MRKNKNLKIKNRLIEKVKYNKKIKLIISQ